MGFIVRSVLALSRKLARWQRYLRLRLEHPGVAWQGTFVGRHVTVQITGGGRFVPAPPLALADNCAILIKHGTLTIGANGHVGIGSVITCRDAITIGRDVLIAEYVSIRDQDHAVGGPLPTAQSGFDTAPIAIGDNVWIGAKATITKGVRIGDNCVIGANSVVTTDIPASSVAVGAPARVVRPV